MAATGQMITQEGRLTVGPLPLMSTQGIVALVGMAVAMVCALLGLPLGWLLVSVMTLAASGRTGMRGAIERLPLAGVLVIAAAGAMTLLFGLLGVDVMSSPWSGRLLLAALVPALVAAPLLSVARAPGTRSWAELGLATAPTALMTVIGGALAVSQLGTMTSWFLSGDHVRHLGLVTRTIDAGGVEYVNQTYPRAWHGALALMWSATGSERDEAGLAELIRLQSLATWMVLALVPLALALTAAGLHRRAGGGPVLSGLAGAAAGFLILGPWFYGAYVPRGFETSVLALLVVAVAVLQVMEARADRGALLVVAISGALIAHVWQVLLPVVAALLVLVLGDRWRRRPSTRVLVGDAALLVLSAAVAVPGLLGVARGYGFEAAAVAGDVPPPALAWLAVVAMSAAVLFGTRPRSGLPACATAVGAALITALGLAALAGVGLDSYYPNKTLWTATALGLPLVGAAAAHLVKQAQDEPRVGRPALVLAGSVGGLVLLLCAATPVLGITGSWSAADGRTVIDTVTAEAAPSATVVWRVGTATDDATSQLLLDFYTATATTAPLGLAPRETEEQCALLTSVARPVVLSRAPTDDVRQRFGCAPATEVILP
ncbi:hypothetical protein ACOCJ4_12755 [Knoellia sp. CPCC 206435]|uniref:hypothetical protein n=1 Tax=Knoellia terrae TaxID=3404797 RepID=UPI003B430D42